MADDIDTLAAILYAARYKSRRQAKRMLRDAGGHGSAAELDALLASIEADPQRAAIHHQAENLHRADLERQATTETPGEDQPEWLICETPAGARTFIFHHCPAGESFLAEILDGPPGADVPGKGIPLDEGQYLANVLWMDGADVPPHRRRALYEQAREQLRIYDSALDL